MIEFNKKLIFRKFFLDNTYFFLSTIFTLGIIVWVIQAVNYLDFVTEDGHGLEVYFKYSLLNFPKIISRLFPLIFFISIFYTLNKFEDNNELKIFWINGINKIKFIKNLVFYSFFSLIGEKKFIDTVDKLTIYIEKKVDKENYKNIFLKDTGDEKIKFIYADRGKLINTSDERSLKLFDGKIINVNDKKITSFNFKTTNFDLTKYLTKSITDFKLQETKTSDILN